MSIRWKTTKGEFVRQVSSFRNTVSAEPGNPFQPAPDRYHLYVSTACPWAHRTLVVRALKGLEDVLPVSIVDWHLASDKGWHFSDAATTPGAIPDTVNGFAYLHELYFKADPEYSARFTVPVLWDKQLGTVVNNESSEIIRMLNTAFDEWSSAPGLTFYPESLRQQIDDVNAWIYDQINNGVYKTGFATTQDAYERNCKAVFAALARVEDILAESEFLVGSTFTEADIRLFTTMVRFDPVYHTHFKCTSGTVTHDFPNILRWLRRVYQMPKIAATVDMDHIKKHYYVSHIKINPTQVVPLWDGPDLTVPVGEFVPRSQRK
ncbi:S-glutathionyl-(chloro)hydroquinone reductase [Polyrhizophydium stewartii]|uniref:S-glutathionyl-(Chloro)hydroquinone reductase n=1 Tax=Polyrhizophydium stewartii TaxID=2732419 RepID=A0ABR4NHP3_9FUNG